MSEIAKDLISQLLTLSPSDRLGSRGVDEIKAHPFFESIDWETLHLSQTKFLPTLEDPTDTKYFDGRNAVFYSPLEVSLKGTKLEEVELGGQGISKVNRIDILNDMPVMEENEHYTCKAFWNLETINEKEISRYEQNYCKTLVG